MSIIETITDEYHFWNWLKQSGGYKDSFSLEGAKAVQEYFDELSDVLGTDEQANFTEFDPVAWCVEFTEYDSLAEAYKELRYDHTYVEGEAREYFQDNTTLIELDNGHVIVGEF